MEATQLEGPFDGAVVVPVLEHLDWPRAVSSLGRLRVGRCYIVLPQNPAAQESALTPHRPAVGSMEVLRTAHPHLVAPEELRAALSKEGYALVSQDPRPVPDGKTMLGLVFARAAAL